VSVRVRWQSSRWRRATAVLVAAAAATLGAPMVATEPAAAETVRDAQWFLRDLKIEQVHRITKGAGVTVAVIDSGIEAEHPDLSGQVAGGVAIGGAAGGPLVDDDTHGTSMAGLIAAKGGGANHALGIAPGAKLLSVRVDMKGAGFYTDQVASGIRWAADNGAKVINLSLGGDTPLPAQTEAVSYAQSKDVVVVAAAGNRDQGMTGVVAPANLPGVIAVGATGKNGSVHANSVSGATLGVVAPGESMVTTGSRRAGKTTGYVQPTGTSPAAAVVSGVVALIRSKYPDLRAADVVNRLVRTADDLGPAGRDPESGFGRINPLRALNETVPNAGVNPLGQPSTAPSNQAGAASEEYDIRPRSWWRTRIQLFLAGLLLVLALLVAVPVMFVVRSSRRRRQALRAAALRAPYGSGPVPSRIWPTPPPGGWSAQTQPTAFPPASGEPAPGGQLPSPPPSRPPEP
jgi:type VII secretion-associated serine protease mycosin